MTHSFAMRGEVIHGSYVITCMSNSGNSDEAIVAMTYLIIREKSKWLLGLTGGGTNTT